MRIAVQSLATVFGAGLSPFAPGTAGSLVALAAYLLALRHLSQNVAILSLVILCIVAVPICDMAEKHYQKKDDGRIVLDEFVGCWAAMQFGGPAIPYAVLGFGLFRLFDIWKPPPVSTAEKRIPGGAGVVLDDLIAGLLAGMVLFLIRKYIPWSPT